ncbi:hypothetical protein ScPMuIL_018604 [Solemya velum]
MRRSESPSNSRLQIHLEIIAGVCWLTITKAGLCRGIYHVAMSREKCCKRNDIPSMSWSPHISPSPGTLFYWQVITRGASSCQPCHPDCDDVECPENMKCRVRNYSARCVCSPKCDRELRKKGLLCGTDMKEYRNYCYLLRQNCKLEKEIKIAYFGHCRGSCDEVTCHNGGFCVEDQNQHPHCITCGETCHQSNQRSVCGEDNVTYEDACQVKTAICLEGRAITMAYSGPCQRNASCSSISCSGTHRCLTNKDTGQPSCVDCSSQCKKSKYIPVCGTNNVSYRNYCQLHESACDNGIRVKVQHLGKCRHKNRIPAMKNQRNKHRNRLNRRRKVHHWKNRLPGNVP